MTDNDTPQAIRFSKCDVPELPEIPDRDIKAEREAERKRKEENARWLENHMGFDPFGDVW